MPKTVWTNQSDKDWHYAPDSCTLKVFCVSPKREVAHFYLALFNKNYTLFYIFTCDYSQNRLLTCGKDHPLIQYLFLLTSSDWMLYKLKIFCWNGDRRASKHAFRFLCVLAGSLVNTSLVTCHWAGYRVYTQVFLGSPWGHGSVSPDKRHCHQWMSSLFCGFLPNPFIQDLFLWHTSQEFVKMDLYPLSFISVRYGVCSTGRWSLLRSFGRCFGACQRSNSAEERRP